MLNATGIFMIFLFSSISVAFAIGISGFIFFLMKSEVSWTILIQKSLFATQSFTMLAVPLFIFAGNLMNNTGIASGPVKLANVPIGHVYGSIGQVSVVLSTLIGGVSGSTVADAAMECRILGPEMTKRGYAPGWSAAINCLSGLIMVAVPPFMDLIFYGTVGEVPTERLFIASFVSGFIMYIFMMIATSWSARHFGYRPDREKPSSLREIGRAYTESIWALLFPVVLTVLIRDGVMTPSESETFAVFYVLVAGVFVYKELTWGKFRECLIDSVKDISVITMVLAFSRIFNCRVVYDQLPEDVTSFLVGITSNPTVVLSLIIVMLIVCGVFTKTTVVTLIVTPILLPVIKQYDIDPVQSGIIMMATVTMGRSTLPADVTLYTCFSAMDCPVEEATKYSWPLFVAILGTLLICIFLPNLVLFLPNLVYGPSM